MKRKEKRKEQRERTAAENEIKPHRTEKKWKTLFWAPRKRSSTRASAYSTYSVGLCLCVFADRAMETTSHVNHYAVGKMTAKKDTRKLAKLYSRGGIAGRSIVAEMVVYHYSNAGRPTDGCERDGARAKIRLYSAVGPRSVVVVVVVCFLYPPTSATVSFALLYF